MSQYGQDPLPVTPVEYSPKYTVAELKADPNVLQWTKKWTATNFYRHKKKPRLPADLAEKFASAKHDRPYVLYRGIHEYVRNEIYWDPLPSSWSTDINVARRFGSDGMVMKLELPAKFVLIDLELLRLYVGGEREVVIMPGLYRIELPDIDANTQVPTIREMMENGDETIASRWRLPNLLKFCQLKEIRKVHGNNKKALIAHIKRWLTSHIVPADE